MRPRSQVVPLIPDLERQSVTAVRDRRMECRCRPQVGELRGGVVRRERPVIGRHEVRAGKACVRGGSGDPYRIPRKDVPFFQVVVRIRHLHSVGHAHGGRRRRAIDGDDIVNRG